ncbi:hypothetical protein FA95DRAFT_1536216 [Auriscalpium vulgare]|uniref:Uncharacterized protein n=1 Tax=Auriscalpium vulgare TaxID=40419 RepID=A0ACB8S1T5_9AGAM|nr:hypothetical protein FA95DRAFT_1536216 [Auriscalpium vulgare]
MRKGNVNARTGRRRPGSFVVPAANKPLDWSTSYQAGSSSPGEGSSSEDEYSEEDAHTVVGGRRNSVHERWGGAPEANGRPSSLNVLNSNPRPASPQPPSSSDGSKPSGGGTTGRRAFTRSRSPAPHTLANGAGRIPRTPSPSSFFRTRNTPVTAVAYALPGTFSWSWDVPLAGIQIRLLIDAKYAAECFLLLLALTSSAWKLSIRLNSEDEWLALELLLVAFAALMHAAWSHLSFMRLSETASSPTAGVARPDSSPTLRLQELRDRRGPSQPTTTVKQYQSFIWMTVPKNYRTSPDDGLVSGLILGPLIASALYHIALRTFLSSPDTPHPPNWHIEPPIQLSNFGKPFDPAEALVLARRNAVNLSTLCSTILSIHVCASSKFESRYRRRHKVALGERGSVPRSEMRKWWMYTLLVLSSTVALLVLRYAFALTNIKIWQHMSYWEVASVSVFFQFSLYSAVRLAHRGFTLGELSLVVFGATAVFMELVHLTIARIWPVTTPYIKTYRLATPLLIFQIALIPGSLLTGFLLSPLLALSRQIAQRPSRRLRFPHEKQAHRRALAAAFYLGTVVVVGGLISIWAQWCLRGRNPWLWVVYWLLEGRKKWTRPALLAYWGTLGSVSVAGWNRQLARSRRIRPRHATTGRSEQLGVPQPLSDGTTAPSEPTTPPSGGASSASSMFPAVTMPQLPSFPNGANLSAALGATEWLDAADKHVPTLGLNARRKFFHLLAVVMFVPGVAADPAFTHLAFSAAFALFTFAEYVRYFALYPFGASVHVFMNEFLDHKDSGTAILSHFYLLTGCAGSLWFEAPSRLLLYTGVLTVGVGDAVASVVGKRLGRHKWSPTTSKTVEGSVAFTVSVVASAWVLRLCGLVEAFSALRYTVIVGLTSVLEALSVQNDNITLPVYMWSMLAVAAA